MSAATHDTRHDRAREAQHAEELFQRYRKKNFKRTDRLFAVIMVVQWIAAIAVAYFVSPRTWAGSMSDTHLHVYAAIVLGGTITAFPVLLAWWRPTTVMTRHAIAAGQLMMSALLIHLTGGRIETHFHVFVSLAVLASYQDWRVLITGAAVVAVDHAVRGIVWPESVFGVVTSSEFRIVEHAGWVVLEVAFLSVSCVRNTAQQRRTATQQAEIATRNREMDALLDELEDEKERAQAKEQEARELADNVERQRRQLQQRVDHMLDHMERFADGDLTVRLEGTAEGAVGELYEGFNRAVANVRTMLEEVADVVDTAASTATEVRASTDQLAAGAEEQSAQADEVAAAMEEMARTIVSNAETATSTADLAEKNGARAKANGEIILQTTDKMEEIGRVVSDSAKRVNRLGDSSEEIGEIVATIDDIADQTNLLALNAAIEAARAGEHGQGFAVVADEVRQLAERTAKATSEIEEMIHGIQAETHEAVQAIREGQHEVEEGIELADQVGEAFEKIVQAADDVTARIGEIATATEEQSATSEEVSRGVEAISTVSEDQAQGVNQIARVINDLNDATLRLRQLLGHFTIQAHQGPVSERRGNGRPDVEAGEGEHSLSSST